jgi:hypothetical protein
LDAPIVESGNYRIHNFGRQVTIVSEDHPENTKDFEFRSTVHSAQFCHNGELVCIVLANREVLVIDTHNWEVVHSALLQVPTRFIRFMSLSSDGSLAIAGSTNSLFVCDAYTGENLCDIIRGSQEMVENARFAADRNGISIEYAAEDLLENIAQQGGDDIENIYRSIDISSLSAVTHQIPDLSFEALATLEVLYGVDQGILTLDVLSQPHIQAHYNELPEEIRTVIEPTMRNLQEFILENESVVKRAKHE